MPSIIIKNSLKNAGNQLPVLRVGCSILYSTIRFCS